MARVAWDDRELKRKARSIVSAVARTIELFAFDVRDNIADPDIGAPRRSGRLAQWLVVPTSAIRWLLTPLPGVDYASHVIFGTRPHRIVARNARVLRFETASGDIVFRRSVFHPGTQPNDFISRAVARSVSRLDSFSNRALREERLL